MPSEKTTPESESRSSREGREVSEVRERRQAPAQLDRASQREGCRLPARPDRTPHDEAPPACLSGDPTCAPTERILEPEVRRHHRRKRKLLEFTHSSTRATMLMLAAAELKNPRKALLPILGAAGGAIVPALVYTAVNVGSGFEQGWGVPMANDIAFCLGILALLGSRIPAGLRSFLSTLTIADDIIAIMVIAVFYTANLDVAWLAGGLGLFAVLIVFNRLHIYDLLPYLVVGLGMWACFLMSGVHATIAGVLLALAIPARSQVKLDRAPGWFAARARRADDRYDPGEPDIVQKEYLDEVAEIGRVSRLSIPPITRLDHRLHIPVYFFILPLFAFSNASVVLTGMDLLSIVTNPVTIGVFCGLLFGKPLGIFLATWLTVKLKLSDLPQGVNWGHIGGVSVLGGVGFTMAIFVTNLAFVDPNMIAMAKAAILAASLIAGIAGFFILRAVTDEEDEEPVR